MVKVGREFLLRKEFLAQSELESASQTAQTQAVFLAGHDAVTGLHNLAGFTAALQRETRSAPRGRWPLLLLDIEALRRQSHEV